jgi:hypothetical protein
MVLIEELDALDLLIWLGRGTAVAQRLGCDQSTISRRSRQCQQVFNLRLRRQQAGWDVSRIDPLLELEREVHQLYRLRQGRQLRLDASLLAAPLLRSGPPQGWIAGDLDRLGWRRPLQLLQERILDAWVTAMGQELRQLEGGAFCTIPLARTPLQLAGRPGHPLLHQGRLQLNDVRHLPRLAPRQGRYPRTESLLGDAWRRETPAQPMEERQCGDAPGQHPGDALTLHYGTAFSLMNQAALLPLPLELGVCTELTLVVRRDLIEQPAIALLIAELQRRVAAAARAPGVADGALVCVH